MGGLSFHINKNNDTTVGKSKTFATEHVLGRLGRVLSKSCHDTGTCTPSNGFFGEREKKKKSFCHVETFPISAVSTPNVLVLTKTQNQKKQTKKTTEKRHRAPGNVSCRRRPCASYWNVGQESKSKKTY